MRNGYGRADIHLSDELKWDSDTKCQHCGYVYSPEEGGVGGNARGTRIPSYIVQ